MVILGGQHNRPKWMRRCSIRTSRIVLIGLGMTMIFVVMALWQLGTLSDTQDLEYKLKQMSRRRAADLHVGSKGNSSGLAKYANLHSSNWIIVTTINAPSIGIQQMAALKEWTILIIGDKKTPDNWSSPGCIFLSVEEQMTLGYRILQLVPFNNYARKNIGYLFAVQHGAKFIYETDDDSILLDDLKGFDYGTSGSGLVPAGSSLLFNPYSHFGQPSVWPRGYPIERIGYPANAEYSLCEQPTPAVQQGLVDKDPDVDAIYRLTRKSSTYPLDISFDKQAPPVSLPPGVYSPYNCQNTLFSYHAFWSLVLPPSKHFRVVDIWRSYWSLKLMELSQQSVAFYPPNVHHLRNAHDLFDDFTHEVELYRNSSSLVKFLRSWKCTSLELTDCMVQLGHGMSNAGYWDVLDAVTIETWVKDLQEMTYSFPTTSRGGVRRCHTSVIFHAREQARSSPDRNSNIVLPEANNRLALKEEYHRICHNSSQAPASSSLSNHRTTNLTNFLLVIVLRDADVLSIPALELYYRQFFSLIVYCGKAQYSPNLGEKWRTSFITVPGEQRLSVECIDRAVHIGYNVDGYLLVSSDILLHVEMIDVLLQSQGLANLQADAVWFGETVPPLSKLLKSRDQFIIDEIQRFLPKILNIFNMHAAKVNHARTCMDILQNIKKYSFTGGGAAIENQVFLDDILYVPQVMSSLFADLANVISSKSKLVLPFLISCVSSDKQVHRLQRTNEIKNKQIKNWEKVEYFYMKNFSSVVEKAVKTKICKSASWLFS